MVTYSCYYNNLVSKTNYKGAIDDTYAVLTSGDIVNFRLHWAMTGHIIYGVGLTPMKYIYASSAKRHHAPAAKPLLTRFVIAGIKFRKKTTQKR